MLDPNAILRFADNQKRLLRKTYDGSWTRGVRSYVPDEDPENEPTLPPDMATNGKVGADMLVARQRYKYVPPRHPDPLRRAGALALAFWGVNKMIGELSALGAGEAPQMIIAQGDSGLALAQWVDANGWRLAAGDSVAWAGEQAGFAEAANLDGQLLYSWMSVGDNRVCSDCELLSGFPPMALGEWPTSPGAGDTECMYGCRCGWDTWDGAVSSDYVPQLSSTQSDMMAEIADRQAQALNDLLPDVNYLS